MRFTIASDISSYDTVVIGVGKKGKSFHPWTYTATLAALEAGLNCGCGLCHNCHIRDQFEGLWRHSFKNSYSIDQPIRHAFLEHNWDQSWAEFGPTKDGLTI